MVAEARRGLVEPVETWRAEGLRFDACSPDLDELVQDVGERRIEVLTLIVAEPGATDIARVELRVGSYEFGDLLSFDQIMPFTEADWFTYLTVREPVRSDAEDKRDQIRAILRGSTVLKRHTRHIVKAQILLQAAAVGGVIEYDKLFPPSHAIPQWLNVLGMTLNWWGMASLVHVGARILLTARVRLTDSSRNGWWSRLVGSPNHGTAIGAIIGIVALLVALASLVHDLLTG